MEVAAGAERTAAAALAALLALLVSTGRLDEPIVFVVANTAVGAAVASLVPAMDLPSRLARLAGDPTDALGAARAALGAPRADADVEHALLALAGLAAGAAVALLARRSLARYSPALCLVLYCSGVSVALRDAAVGHVAVQAGILAGMLLLSLASKHVRRLHEAASAFSCCLFAADRLAGTGDTASAVLGSATPLGISLCLLVGLLACVVHDLFVHALLQPALKAAHIAYALAVALLAVDTTLELVTGRSAAEAAAALRRSAGLGGDAAAPLAAPMLLAEVSWERSWEAVLALARPEQGAGPSLAAAAAPLCAVFGATMAVRQLVSPDVVWRSSRARGALSVAVAVAVAAALLVAREPHAPETTADKPVLVALAVALVYAQVARATAPAPDPRPKRWYTMTYWVDAFPAASQAGPKAAAAQGAASEPPPFVLQAHEDHRIKFLLRDLAQQQRARTTAANALRCLERRAGMVEGGGESDATLMDLARHRSALVVACARVAATAERVALQLRELASDAETEIDTLDKIKRYTRSQASKHEHHMVIKRQSDNAMTSFRWLGKELELAEKDAERQLDLVNTEVRAAVRLFTRCRQRLADTAPLEALIRDEFTPALAPVFDTQQLDCMLRPRVRGEAGAAATDAQLPRQLAGAQQATTPYDVAMINKHGPSILAADEHLVELPRPGESQRSKRRWWPFSLGGSSGGAGASGNGGASPSRRSLRKKKKDSRPKMNASASATLGSTATTTPSSSGTSGRRLRKTKSSSSTM